MRRAVLVAIVLAGTGLAGPVPARAAGRPGVTPAVAGPQIAPIPRGVVKVIAKVPPPGYPALPLVWGGDIYEGTYTSVSGSGPHSHVFKFSPQGALLDNWTISDQPDPPYGVQVANVDAAGQLVVMDDTSGQIWLMNRTTGARTLYATIPNIPVCSAPGASSECSDATLDETPEPDYAAWGPDGSLYVTDYQQAVIWRVPPHGGTPSIWLSSAALNGTLFGTAGIWMEADPPGVAGPAGVAGPGGYTLLFDQASNLLGGSDLNEAGGKLYSVQIEPNGSPGVPELLWRSDPATLPDGFAVAQSGDIYLAQIGPTGNDIVELSPTGRLITTFGTPVTGANGSSIPFDEPSGVAYFDDDLIIANQSYLAGDSAHQALLALGTGEYGEHVYVPADAGPVSRATPPVKRKSKATARTGSGGRR